jgi:hypothetical protein
MHNGSDRGRTELNASSPEGLWHSVKSESHSSLHSVTLVAQLLWDRDRWTAPSQRGSQLPNYIYTASSLAGATAAPPNGCEHPAIPADKMSRLVDHVEKVPC